MIHAGVRRLILGVLAASLLAGAGGCGPAEQPQNGQSPAGPKIRQLDVDGHSVAFGAVASKPGPHGTGVGSRVAQALGLTEDLRAKSGSTLQETGLLTDGWANVFRNRTRPPKPGKKPVRALPRMALLFYGANDIALYGPNLSVAKQAFRAIIARHRAGAVYEAGPSTHPSIVPGSFSPVPVKPGQASGDGYLASAGPGTLTINVKKGPIARGATLDLGFIQKFGTSARYRIAVDGKEKGTLQTTSPLKPTSTGYVPAHDAATFVYRIKKLKPGPHEIQVTADQVVGEAGFDYWQIEPPRAEPVVLIKQYTLPPPPNYPGAIKIASPSEVASINKMVDDLAKEFGPRVITVDTESLVKGMPNFLSVDLVHPTQPGHDALAQAVVKAIRESPFAGQLP